MNEQKATPINQPGSLCAPGIGEVWCGVTSTVSPPSPAKKLLQHFNEPPRRDWCVFFLFLSGPNVLTRMFSKVVKFSSPLRSYPPCHSINIFFFINTHAVRLLGILYCFQICIPLFSVNVILTESTHM